MRKSPEGGKRLLFVLNMSPDTIAAFKVGVPERTAYRLLLSSAEKRFGGTGEKAMEFVLPVAEPKDGQPCSLTLTLPAYSALVYVF